MEPTPKDADRLFDETVRRMLKTPPKPHEEMKLGKRRRKAEPARPSRSPGLNTAVAAPVKSGGD
jgi:hypothetical protein